MQSVILPDQSPCRVRPNDVGIASDDVSRLLALVGELASRKGWPTGHAIDAVCALITLSLDGLDQQQLAKLVSRLHRARMLRNKAVGSNLFRDPAWDMLLDLFAANERGIAIPRSSLCHGSGVPLSTAMRYIDQLEEFGLAVCAGDPEDLRRSCVRPTPKSIEIISSFIKDLASEVVALALPSAKAQQAPRAMAQHEACRPASVQEMQQGKIQ